jgi:hypothetical protein
MLYLCLDLVQFYLNTCHNHLKVTKCCIDTPWALMCDGILLERDETHGLHHFLYISSVLSYRVAAMLEGC